MSEEQIEPPPEPTATDRAVSVALAVLSEFPGGSTVVGVLNEIFGLPYERRHEAWLRRMHALLAELQSRGFDLIELGNRPEFVTAVHDATRIALGEHLEQKLDQLKAVLLNVAIHEPDTIADLWALRYLRWIDELEPVHIEILAFGIDPRSWLESHGKRTEDFVSGPRRAVFDQADWPYPKDLIDLVVEDLGRLGLGSVGSGMVSGQAMYSPWISDRGKRFLDWLTIV